MNVYIVNIQSISQADFVRRNPTNFCKAKPAVAKALAGEGGDDGIRTHEALTPTPLARGHIRPL